MKLFENQYMVFVSPVQLEEFDNGEIVVALTKSFTDKDVPLMINANEYGKESESGTLVWIKKGGWT